jgi:ElaB/YqjD/DUF883 family membrane-anchored ribosome-binding protein
MNDMTTVNKDKLASDLKIVVTDAEDLMRTSAGQAREDLARIQATAAAKAKALGHNTDVYVHENPWKAIGIAAGIGVLVGLLAGRR